MYIPTSFETALLMMVTTTICWGSWANTYKLTKGYRFELFYWDYAIGIVLVSLLLALTMGSTGGPGGFIDNVRSADTNNIVLALAAGFIFNVANLLLVAGIEMAGLAFAFPVAIGIALVEGVVLSYVLQPKGNPTMLGLGVALAILAIVADGRAYGSRRSARGPTEAPEGSPATAGPPSESERGWGPASSKESQAVSRKSMIVCIVSGLLMGAFAPLVTRALTSGRPLGPYSTAVFFTLGAFLCCFVVNVYFMKKPLVGEPVDFGDYFRQGPADHLFGVLGGFIWGTGMVFNFVAASLVGVAISYAIGQAAPMVAALWGVFVWNEFRGANRSAQGYLVAMFVCYVLAIVTIARAYVTA